MDTYLLGAGFSRAFHSPMPLMRDLGARVVEELGLPPFTLDPFGDDVEAWLSYLASPQPWDELSTSLRNEARFIEASKAISECISRAGDEPDQRGRWPQSQLHRLVLDWRLHRTPVLTFNYDLLIERAVRAWDPSITGWDLYPAPLVLRDAPAEDLTSGRVIASPHRRFKLLKLHGSINWYHSLHDESGPITLADYDPGSAAPKDGRRAHLLSDLQPLIVPPTSSKSTFYAGDAIRALWLRAARTLEATDRLIVIGYSFPPLTCRYSPCCGEL